ncbi:MAG TPA: Ku protein [Acidimicrobiales bacterium]|nr:Ku protein [Acidimicrobiales bacterium]
MPRSMWSGSVSFGLVNVPVKAFTAVHDHEVHFHQIDKKSGSRIRNQKVSASSHKAVDADDIEMGYEVSDGRYVSFTKQELADLKPESTRTIDISDFVALDDIDPIYYERTYWLAPDGDGATKAYRLLLAAMEKEQRVGIGSVVMRNKQYLAAIRPLDGALAMSTMRFADEVVPRAEIDGLPERRAKPPAKELALATQIIEALASEWEPERYHDTYTEELRGLIKRKAKGETITPEEAPPERENVVDLMEALRASVDTAKGTGRGRRRSASTKRTRKRTARRTTSRRASRKSA